MTITVLGAGAFGSAMAISLASNGHKINLWSRDKNSLDDLKNSLSLKGFPTSIDIPKNIFLTTNITRAYQKSSVSLLCIPAQQTKSFLKYNLTSIKTIPTVLCAKGIDINTLQLQTEIVKSLNPTIKTAVLTGPSFALEIAQKKPSALTLACTDSKTGIYLQDTISNESLRIYLTKDIIGTQIGGSLKNVIAIACGIVVGKNLGESAKTAVMTRGFAEIKRLGLAMGATSKTFSGLSGFGDLALTCNSKLSRNFSTGISIASNSNLENNTVEGLTTARAALALADKYNVDVPIIFSINQILNDFSMIDKVISSLLTRPLISE